MRRLIAWIRRYRASIFLAFVAAAAVVWAWFALTPTSVRVALPAQESTETQIVSAYAEAFASQGKDTRLKIVKYDSLRAASEALERNEVEFALVRPDVAYPRNGLTAAILRDEALIIAAPASKKVEGIENLVGKRLGMVMRDNWDPIVLDTVLNFYGASGARIAVVALQVNELNSAELGKRVDAVGFIGTPREEATTRLVRAAATGFGEDVSIVSFEGLEPLSIRNPALHEVSVQPGTFGLKPKLPAEEVKTPGLSYRLVAADGVDRITVSRVVQYMFEMRPRIAHDHPSVNVMRAPDSDGATSAVIPNHRGALDYFNREQQSFMDRWGDFLWLGLFAAGGLTSIMAWVRGLFARRRRELSDRILDRLLCLAAETREATDAPALAKLAGELETLVAHAVRHARLRALGHNTMSSIMLAIDAARAAIAERRRALGPEADHQSAPPSSRLAFAAGAEAAE